VNYTTGATDLAENYYSSSTLEAGEIIESIGMYLVDRATSSSQRVIGIVSTKPGIILGEGERDAMPIAKYPIALSGRVPVKVSDANGPIFAGDRIVLSDVPGVGVRESSSTPFGAVVVGIALEGFDGTNALSEITRDVLTENVATGTPVCTSRVVVRDHTNGGGGDLEGSNVYGTSTTYIEEECTQERVDVRPEAGDAEATTTPIGTSVKIGRIAVFVNLSRSVGQTPGLAWDVDSLGNLALQRSIDLLGNDIFNVGRIASIAGTWSIDADGVIRAERVLAKDIGAERTLTVGTEDAPSGITVFDRSTKAPYCIQIDNGAMMALAGSCAGGTSEPAAIPTSSLPAPVESSAESGLTPALSEETIVSLDTPPAVDPAVPPLTPEVPPETDPTIVLDSQSQPTVSEGM
jgi:hypothetical protein